MEVEDRPEQHRFVANVDGRVAELVYQLDGDRLILIHTGVPGKLAGSGIGGQLVRASIDRAVRDGLTIVPACPFARQWIKDHGDEIGDVAIEWGPGSH